MNAKTEQEMKIREIEAILRAPKNKVVPVTGSGGLWGCEMLTIPHFLNKRLIDGGEVVSLTRRPSITPRKIPGTHSVRGGVNYKATVRLEGLE
jgi:hypothetical protein